MLLNLLDLPIAIPLLQLLLTLERNRWFKENLFID